MKIRKTMLLKIGSEFPSVEVECVQCLSRQSLFGETRDTAMEDK